MLEARNHLLDVGTGDTRPQLFSCYNGNVLERWVLKLMDGAVAELAADWIGSLLAHRVGLYCPSVDVASVSAEALSTAPPGVQAWARPGPAFASKELRNCKPIDSEYELVSMARRDDGAAETLGRLYALDAWLDVLDRQKPDGSWNLLRDNSTGDLCVIDFGKSLTSCLLPVLGTVSPPIDPPYPTGAKLVADGRAALMACATIESIGSTELEEMISSVPSAWVDVSTRPKVADFLCERAALVRDSCRGMHGGSSWN